MFGLRLPAQLLIYTALPRLLKCSGTAFTPVIYPTAGAISFFFVLFLVKETRGTELEEMA